MRIRLDISYDGAPFRGWAIQPGLPTVQGALETALGTILRQPVALTVAGRTDAGVHAIGQVAHFDCGGEIPSNLLSRLNSVLHLVLSGALPAENQPVYPEQAVGAVVVRDAQSVPESFDARFSALSRHYVYRIVDAPEAQNPLYRHMSWWYSHPLSELSMHEAASLLLGEHDFAAFCKPRQGATTIRTLQHLEVVRAAPGCLEIRVSADAFCHSMVRSLVGALTEIGRCKREEAWLSAALSAKQRLPEIPVAPAQGLTLAGVDYPKTASEMASQQTKTRRLRCPEMANGA